MLADFAVVVILSYRFVDLVQSVNKRLCHGLHAFRAKSDNSSHTEESIQRNQSTSTEGSS